MRIIIVIDEKNEKEKEGPNSFSFTSSTDVNSNQIDRNDGTRNSELIIWSQINLYAPHDFANSALFATVKIFHFSTSNLMIHVTCIMPYVCRTSNAWVLDVDQCSRRFGSDLPKENIETDLLNMFLKIIWFMLYAYCLLPVSRFIKVIFRQMNIENEHWTQQPNWKPFRNWIFAKIINFIEINW